MTDEEKRKFEIIKSILEDLKEISKPPNPEKKRQGNLMLPWPA